jgi:hypothetical protein
LNYRRRKEKLKASEYLESDSDSAPEASRVIGQADSGKSTLIGNIRQDPRTQEQRKADRFRRRRIDQVGMVGRTFTPEVSPDNSDTDDDVPPVAHRSSYAFSYSSSLSNDDSDSSDVSDTPANGTKRYGITRDGRRVRVSEWEDPDDPGPHLLSPGDSSRHGTNALMQRVQKTDKGLNFKHEAEAEFGSKHGQNWDEIIKTRRKHNGTGRSPGKWPKQTSPPNKSRRPRIIFIDGSFSSKSKASTSKPPKKRLRYIPGGPGGGGGRYVDDEGTKIPVGGTGPGGYNYIGPRGRIGRANAAMGLAPQFLADKFPCHKQLGYAFICSTISKDNTPGESARQSELLAGLGKRLQRTAFKTEEGSDGDGSERQRELIQAPGDDKAERRDRGEQNERVRAI